MACSDDDDEADLWLRTTWPPGLLGNWHKIKGNLQIAVMGQLISRALFKQAFGVVWTRASQTCPLKSPYSS